MSLSAASVSSLIMGLGPPRIGLASSRPSVWAVSTQRYTLERPTANRRATTSRDCPPSSAAATTRRPDRLNRLWHVLSSTMRSYHRPSLERLLKQIAAMETWRQETRRAALQAPGERDPW